MHFNSNIIFQVTAEVRLGFYICFSVEYPYRIIFVVEMFFIRTDVQLKSSEPHKSYLSYSFVMFSCFLYNKLNHHFSVGTAWTRPNWTWRRSRGWRASRASGDSLSRSWSRTRCCTWRRRARTRANTCSRSSTSSRRWRRRRSASSTRASRWAEKHKNSQTLLL